MSEKLKEVKSSACLKMDYSEVNVGGATSTRLKLGINNLSKAVLTTMGPKGHTVIIFDNQGNPYVTKDGVSVAKSIAFKNPIENIGANLIKQVAEKTVREVGDGTTTSICLANAFINEGYTAMYSGGIPYPVIVEYLNQIASVIDTQLDKVYKRPLQKEDIFHVATIAANNDRIIGGVINDAFSAGDNIQLKPGNTETDVIEVIDGMELPTGIFSNMFINNTAKQSIEYDKATLLIVEGEMSSLKGLKGALVETEMTTPIIIIADHFTDAVLKILRNAYNKGEITVGLIKSPGFASHRKTLIRDIIRATQARKSTMDNVYVGKINNIKATKYTTVISYNRTEDSDILVNELEVAKDNTEEDHLKRLLQERIDILKGKMINILVGGTSELDMKERYDRIEDAVLATKCAIKGGVIDGGGLPLYKIGQHGGNPLFRCLKAPMDTMQLSEKDIKENVIDPLEVTKAAVNNAISVAKVILGTNAIVLPRHLWN